MTKLKGNLTLCRLKKLVSLKLALAFVFGLMGSAYSQAEMKKTLGEWDVHYIAFTSTFISPEIARANDILRSSKNAIVNISVLDRQSKEAQDISISGTATNLLGTSKELSFTKVVEGQAIYYLAQVSFAHKELLRFDIELTQGNAKQRLKFQQTMYVEE